MLAEGRRRFSFALLLFLLPGVALSAASVLFAAVGFGTPGFGPFKMLLFAAGVVVALLGYGLYRALFTARTKQGRTLSPRKRLLFGLITCSFLSLLLLGACEVGLRLAGERPWRLHEETIVVEPGGKFYAHHPSLGYGHLPGAFRLTLRDNYTFTATHGPDGLRLTRPAERPAGPKPLWIFGCSITHGFSVNDQETYPWLLQEKLPDHDVINFGTCGYGTVHSLIQFKNALFQGPKPGQVVVAYASLHDERNTFLRKRRKMLVPHSKLGDLVQPYARLDGNGKLQIQMAEGLYTEFPGMRQLALMHALEEAYNNVEDRFYDSHQVSKAILAEFADLCTRNEIELVVAGIIPDPATADTLEYCKQKGIRTVQIGVDLKVPENSNKPYDGHPSARAHREYAESLYRYLNEHTSLARK